MTHNDQSQGEGSRFEDGLFRLESIVETMESSELPLEESLRLFEEGIALARRLEGQLGEAEMKVETLLRTARGEETAAFEPPADAP